jgi:hypothetical protein
MALEGECWKWVMTLSAGLEKKEAIWKTLKKENCQGSVIAEDNKLPNLENRMRSIPLGKEQVPCNIDPYESLGYSWTPGLQDLSGLQVISLR